jgi:hypothetical protein
MTYQKMGEADKSQGNLEKAIELFEEMTALHQVEKVRSAMDSCHPKAESVLPWGELNPQEI